MKNILFVYGCGGHKSQALRLQKLLSDKNEGAVFFTITDEGKMPEWSSGHLELGELRDKYTGKILPLKILLANILAINEFLKKNRIKNIISLGPGVCIPTCIIGKLRGCVLIHIETWSKFETLTYTTKIMKLITKNILYQNEELKKLLPKAKYVGRL